MALNRNQINIIFAVIFSITLLVAVFIFGWRGIQEKPPEVTLNIWGLEDRFNFQDNIFGYESLRSNVHVNYQERNPETFEKDVVNALAAGTGPDIIMFHNTWLLKHFNKIVPLKDEQLNKTSFRELYPTVVEQDFAPQDKIYALPLYIDTLALFYNQDTFDKKGVAVTPKDWLDFQNLVPKLIEKDSFGKITKPAAAIGGSEDNIDNAADVALLLMLQAGAKMTNEDFSAATFAQNVNTLSPGLDALTFYSKFTNPNDIYYTWNSDLEDSSDSFSRGNAAMIFNYASKQKEIKSKNPFLNFKVAEMPQPSGSDKAVNYPNYWGLTVTNNSDNPDWAWDYILYTTANEFAAEKYLLASENPPALRSLIQKYVDHPEFGVFAKQALSARSWLQIDKDKISEIISEMINATNSKQLNANAALYQAEQQVTQLMRAN
ncbi:extracellular solute-binding protein [Candidatus Wolfebacteria bacterium]|nr:extracellular solute-binding protein [Candidatus Wolfebacteria bacterium]